MGGRCPEPAEVVRGGDDAAPEQVVPDAVDHDPGRQRVVGVGEVVGERAAAALRAFVAASAQHLEEAARYGRCRPRRVAALEQRVVGGVRLDQAGHARRGRGIEAVRAHLLHQLLEVFERVELVGEQPVADARVQEERVPVAARAAVPAVDGCRHASAHLLGELSAVCGCWVRGAQRSCHAVRVEPRAGRRSGLRLHADLTKAEEAVFGSAGLHRRVLAGRQLDVRALALPVAEVDALPAPAVVVEVDAFEGEAAARVVLHDEPEVGRLSQHQGPRRLLFADVEAVRVQDAAVPARVEVRVGARGVDALQDPVAFGGDGEGAGGSGAVAQAVAVEVPAFGVGRPDAEVAWRGRRRGHREARGGQQVTQRCCERRPDEPAARAAPRRAVQLAQQPRGVVLFEVVACRVLQQRGEPRLDVFTPGGGHLCLEAALEVADRRGACGLPLHGVGVVDARATRREHAVERVVVGLADRVELVVVAARAGDRLAEEGLAEHVDLVVDEPDLLLERLGRQVAVEDEAVVRGADHGLVDAARCVDARRLQQVARDVLSDQLVVGNVLVERADQVVAVLIRVGDRRVAFGAVGVRVAHDVHPVPSPAFAVGGGREQLVDDPLQRVVARVLLERAQRSRGRREPGERVVQAPEQHPTRGLRRALQAARALRCGDEAVDGVCGPVVCRRRFVRDDRLQTPPAATLRELRAP